jgi:hypothetical protein
MSSVKTYLLAYFHSIRYNTQMPDTDAHIHTKKVFFLFVPEDAEETIIKPVAAQEFETYAFSQNDTEQCLDSLDKFPGSIVFAFLYRNEENTVWEERFKKLASADTNLQLFISTWIIDAGYITLNANLSNYTPHTSRIDRADGSRSAVNHFITMLETLNARGDRKHLRAMCGESLQAHFSIKRLEQTYTGTILDISSFGMACAFNKDIELKIHLFIDDLQLRLVGQSFSIAGSILSKRVIGDKTVYIIVFDFLNDPDALPAVKNFVYEMLQRNFRQMRMDDGTY